MPSPGETAAPRRPSVFLSYPSEDREAARSLRDALSANGLEVWYDEEELTGGDAWDQKIRRQIRECDYFMPLISAHSESRREGYFRREWRLAVERTLDMADDHLFLLPVVTDGTEQSGARVPERFLTVQWLRVAGGRPTPALVALCQRLVAGETEMAAKLPRRIPPPLKPPPAAAEPPLAPPAAPPAGSAAFPPFPNQEPGQPVKFWVHVAMWLGKVGWIQFKRLPRVIRILIYCYLCYLLITNRGGRPKLAEAPETPPASSATQAKLAAIASRYEAGEHKGDAVKLGADIARELAAELGDKPAVHAPLLVFPFVGRGGSPEDERVADTTFAMLFAKLSIARPGKVAVQPPKLGPDETAPAFVSGAEHHARYLILGGIVAKAAPTPAAPAAAVGPTIIPAAESKTLSVQILNVKTGASVWSQDYPVEGLDPDKLAADVEQHLPDLDDDDD